MKKRIFSLFLCAALSCASLPFAAGVSAAPAADAAPVIVSSISLRRGLSVRSMPVRSTD